MLQPPPDLKRRKRELRLKIGRLRRRIDGHARAAQREGGRLLSWRTVVRRLPGNALLAAFGLGLAMAAGFSARSMARWLGLKMVRSAFSEGLRVVGAELQRVWADAASRPASSEETARHD